MDWNDIFRDNLISSINIRGSFGVNVLKNFVIIFDNLVCRPMAVGRLLRTTSQRLLVRIPLLEYRYLSNAIDKNQSLLSCCCCRNESSPCCILQTAFYFAL